MTPKGAGLFCFSM